MMPVFCPRRHARRPPNYLTVAGLVLAFALPGLSTCAHGQDRPASQSNAAASNAAGVSEREAHTYRLTYAIIESDGGKRTATQHYAMTIVAGERATFKQGNKVPVLTGGYSHEGTPETTQYQFTYLDVGLNLDAALREVAGGVQVRAKVELSSIVDQVNPQLLKDPGVRQTVLETVAMARVGTPVTLGSLDIPDSTRHLDIEVTVERMP